MFTLLFAICEFSREVNEVHHFWNSKSYQAPTVCQIYCVSSPDTDDDDDHGGDGDDDDGDVVWGRKIND